LGEEYIKKQNLINGHALPSLQHWRLSWYPTIADIDGKMTIMAADVDDGDGHDN
jgi:hypothetical protein